MNVEVHEAFLELERPYWKFWRWRKRKRAEYVLDDFIHTVSVEEETTIVLPNRAGELIEALYGVYTGAN